MATNYVVEITIIKTIIYTIDVVADNEKDAYAKAQYKLEIGDTDSITPEKQPDESSYTVYEDSQQEAT